MCRVIEACLVTLICVAAIFMLPHFFGSCLPIQKMYEGINSFKLQRFALTCGFAAWTQKNLQIFSNFKCIRMGLCQRVFNSHDFVLWWVLEFEELQLTWFWGLLERGSRMAWNLTTCLFDLKVWSFMWIYVTLQHCYVPWFFRQEDDEYWFRYTCPVHEPKTDVRYYNDLASLYFAIPSQVPTIPLQNGCYSKFDGPM